MLPSKSDIRKACKSVKYKVDTIVIPEHTFNVLLLSEPFTYQDILKSYHALGVVCIVPDADQPEGTFNVSSGLLSDGTHIMDSGAECIVLRF